MTQRDVLAANCLAKPYLVVRILLFCLVAGSLCGASAQSQEWHARDLPFKVLGITSIGSSLWACGPNESIAVSSDGGATWQIKHQTPDGGLLLNVGFTTEQFGYAAGTSGLLLTTEDSGVTWQSHSVSNATILQISFADREHGLVRTPASLLFTSDGGATWKPVPSGAENPDELKLFPYTFSLATLDAAHMAVMLKQGAAQYEPQSFLVTEDTGKSWHVVNIPNVTLYSFLRVHDRYWAIGTEVIHKDQPGGGYAVPVALYSSDGLKWEHSTNDLAACKSEMCVACTTRGCLSANGSVANVFLDKTELASFTPNQKLTSKWAATNSTICFLDSGMECAELKPMSQIVAGLGAVPPVVSPGPLGSKVSQGPVCIVCTLDQMLIDNKAQGMFTIHLVLGIAKNGTVASVAAEGAPTPEIKSRIEQQAQSWIFEPYLKDGIPVNLKLNTNVQVNVIKSR
jgi:hypothetical protein